MLFNALVTSSKMLVQASDARNRWMLTGGYESPDATPSTYEPLYAGQAKGAYSQGAIPPPCAISFLRVLRPACAGDGGVSWLTYPLMQTGKGRAKWRN